MSAELRKVTSTLLILPEEIRDKIYELLPKPIQICLEIGPRDIIYEVLNPYDKRVDLAIVKLNIRGIYVLCDLYGISRYRISKYYHSQELITDFGETKLQCIGKCRQCAIYIIKAILFYWRTYKDIYDYIIIYQIQYYKISLLDIYDPYARRCVIYTNSEEIFVPDIYLYREPNIPLLKLLIDNYSILDSSSYNPTLVAIANYDQYNYLSTCMLSLLITLQDVQKVQAMEKYEPGLCKKYYVFIESQSNRLEYKLVWPELVTTTDELTIKLISAQYTKNLLHHLKICDFGLIAIVKSVVEYLFKHYPMVIFDKSIINYVTKTYRSRNMSKRNKSYISLFSDIIDAYNKFIDN